MVVWGVLCRIDHGNLAAVIAVADGTTASPHLVESFEHRGNPAEEFPKQLSEFEARIQAELRRWKPIAVVVRTRDFHARHRVDLPSERRMNAEGVVLATARRHLDTVVAMPGRAIGDLLGGKIADVEMKASTSLGDNLHDVGAAAIAALARAAG